MLWKSDLEMKIIQKAETTKASAGGSEGEQLATEHQPDGAQWEKLKTGHPGTQRLNGASKAYAHQGSAYASDRKKAWCSSMNTELKENSDFTWSFPPASITKGLLKTQDSYP